MAKLRLAILGSGPGTTAQAVLDACADPDYPAEVILIGTDRDCGLEELGDMSRVRHHRFDSSTFGQDELLRRLAHDGIDLGLLLGCKTILSAEFLGACPVRLCNLHPSLLSFGKGLYGEAVWQLTRRPCRSGLRMTPLSGMLIGVSSGRWSCGRCGHTRLSEMAARLRPLRRGPWKALSPTSRRQLWPPEGRDHVERPSCGADARYARLTWPAISVNLAVTQTGSAGGKR